MERKVCFIWDAGSGAGEGEGGFLSRGQLPHPRQSGGKSFYRHREGAHAETARSALTVILKLVIGNLISVILIVLSTVNLQFQGQFVPISLRPLLRAVASYVMATGWSSCS